MFLHRVFWPIFKWQVRAPHMPVLLHRRVLAQVPTKEFRVSFSVTLYALQLIPLLMAMSFCLLPMRVQEQMLNHILPLPLLEVELGVLAWLVLILAVEARDLLRSVRQDIARATTDLRANLTGPERLMVEGPA